MRERELRIVIPGGTGRLGMILARHFHEQGHAVSTITRFPKSQPWPAVHWDAQTVGDWITAIDGADVVINFAGSSILCRHDAANQRSILETRVRTTRLIGQAIGQCSRPPVVWLNASNIDIYPNSDLALDENAGLSDEAANYANDWEQAATEAITPHTRKVVLRLAPIMSPASGLFPFLLWLVRRGFGGELGSGDQYVAWLHDFDFIRSVESIIRNEDIHGACNLTSPQALPNHEFMHELRQAWCTSYFGLPIPTWFVKTAAFALGRDPNLVLQSRNIQPQRLLKSGFDFHFPEWRGACENLVQRWHAFHGV